LLLAEADQLIVLGDFNLPNISCLESIDSLAMIPRMQNDFIDGLVELSLQQVNRIPNHIGRLLDLIFVFNISDAEASRISPLSLPEDCYYPTLQLCINGFFNNPRTVINVQTSLCFKRTDYGRLVESLSTVSWSFLVDLPVDDAVRYFYEVLYRLRDRIHNQYCHIGMFSYYSFDS